MNAIVVYDSYFGNTEKIAVVVGAALDAKMLRASEVTLDKLNGTDLLVVGSPTRGFRPSDATRALLKSIPAGKLAGMKAAAFDTRMEMTPAQPGILRFLVSIFGYAASPIAKQLAQKGAALVGEPAGFIVKDTQGPLKDGEIERAAEWAKTLLPA